MPFFIKVVPLEKAGVEISLVIIFAVQEFKCIGIWFILFGFKLRQVGLKICFAISNRISV